MSFGAARPIPVADMRYAATPEGAIYSLLDPIGPRLLAGVLCKDGYRRYGIRFLDGSRKMMAGHRLVADAYLPNLAALPEVNHIDGNKQNNAVVNLEWCDRRHNIRHAVATGLHRAAPRHARANKASVGELRAAGLTLRKVADALGCSIATAHRYSSMVEA